MTHRDEQQWLSYIMNELSEPEREQAEAHLYSCDSCLARWERVLSSLGETALATLEQQSGNRITNAVMEAVAQQPVYEIARDAGQAAEQARRVVRFERRPKEERRRAILHYAIAVCITLLLMSTGLWKAIDAGIPAPAEHDAHRGTETVSQQPTSATYTERMMNHTVGLLEHWTDKAAGAEAKRNDEKGMGS